MLEIENECVGCPQGCINCGRKHVPHYYCDTCGEEFEPDDLYEDDGSNFICEKCILSQYSKISVD